MNHITIIGRLGADPELRQTKSGDVCNMRIAADTRKDQPSIWWSVAAWGKLGEVCASNLRKGRKVCVVGDIRKVEVYDSAKGPGVRLEVDARDVVFLDAKDAGQEAQAPATQATAKPGGWGDTTPGARWGTPQSTDDPIPF